jgi:glycosyltransferase involved in cell wall biosynthesis
MANDPQSPLISVITPVLDGERFIEDAIRSVLRQEYKRFEHVVVDGGSTDGTVEILKRYPHLRWVSEPDRGQSDAMNKGFDLSSGEVVVYLNADDYF